jgi:NADH dehydrogenase
MSISEGNMPIPGKYEQADGLPRVLVIGGGFAGLQFVQKLDATKYRVLMLDRHNYHTFQPLLYQVATAGLEPDSIAQPIRKVFAHRPNFFFRMATVNQIDPSQKEVHTDIGTFPYDILVVAVGTKTNYFGNDGLRLATFPLKQVPNALDLRSHILQSFEAALQETNPEIRKAHLHFAIVGGGPTGVELAGALAELRGHVLPADYPELDFSEMKISLIDSMPRVLATMSAKSSALAEKYLQKFGVQLFLGKQVVGLQGHTLSLSDGSKMFSQNVIWSAGVTGNLMTGFPAEAITPSNRLRVDSFNEVLGCPNVFALGDIASMESAANPKGHPQLAPVAIQQGVLLGKNLNRKSKGLDMKPFSYFNKGSMATIGRNKAVVDLPNGSTFGGIIAWFAWMFVHLMYLIGFRNKFVVMANWVYSYLTYDRGTRLIIRPYIRAKVSPAATVGLPEPIEG